ncbi:class I SAM-dependent methyltransferase [uncultured Maritimibacter sp.]|uniref:class I SAM-dependent DNA methyltransferase n=1 Tax=uncultured Maritimibacter sp. TaxID=991866 RepID=UPI00262CCD7E|nr:class I SAM-dependent methyltransferase [uncultured Maritimibacter sp.]
MSADPRTLAVYDARTTDYARMVSAWQTPGLEGFLTALPRPGHVLDLGCGPGLDARAMMDAGLAVDAVDASTAMVMAAREIGVPARQATFDQIDGTDIYDGIWANFSLLHAPRAALPGHLTALARALKPAALLHIGMKLGEGEGRDALGRYYTYYDEDDLVRHLTMSGFTPRARFKGMGKGLSGEQSPWIWLQATKEAHHG